MNKLSKILGEDAASINRKVNLKELAGKQVIITGATGLVGINILMSLKKFGEVNKSLKPPKITALVHTSIPSVFQNILTFKNLQVKKGDVTNQNFINSLPQADYIIHAAGYGQPGKFMDDKLKTIAINTVATIGLLEKLKPNGKFLFISSSEVYSGLAQPPYVETDIGNTSPAHPRACYIEGKRGGETICRIYFDQGVQAKSIRLSLAYGPGTRPGDARVLNSFIEKGLQGNICLLDRGQARRTYCYISDAVEMIWKVLLFGTEPVYNVGGNSRLTIAQLARKIGQQLGVPVVLPKIEKQLTGAPSDVYLSMTKFTKEFGNIKYIPLNQGLKRTILWQKALYANF